MSTAGDVQYIGGFQYIGGYHDYMSTLGDIQYIGGHHDAFGGYHEYIRGCSVHLRVTMSTSGCSVHQRDTMSTLGRIYHEYIGGIERILSACSATCIMTSPNVLNIL